MQCEEGSDAPECEMRAVLECSGERTETVDYTCDADFVAKYSDALEAAAGEGIEFSSEETEDGQVRIVFSYSVNAFTIEGACGSSCESMDEVTHAQIVQHYENRNRDGVYDNRNVLDIDHARRSIGGNVPGSIEKTFTRGQTMCARADVPGLSDALDASEDAFNLIIDGDGERTFGVEGHGCQRSSSGFFLGGSGLSFFVGELDRFSYDCSMEECVEE